MPDSFRQALVASGTTHIVVVSGYNISLVAAVLHRMMLGRRVLATVVPFVGVWGFTLLSGGGAPSVRAAIMATASLLALAVGRGADALAALGLATAVMLFVDPSLATDLSFQLSALATLGLISLQPRLSEMIRRVHGAVREPLAATLAAQLATMPLLAGTFHQVSLVSPLANLLAAPFIPIATIGGAILLPLAAAVPALSPLVGVVLAVPTRFLVAVIDAAAQAPLALIPFGDPPPFLTLLYAAALVAWAAAPTPEGRDFLAAVRGARWARPAIGVAAAAAAAMLLVLLRPSEPSRLSVSVLDVGDGDAIFVRTPGQRTILVDGGPNPAALLGEIGHRLGLAERSLTLAVLTSADSGRLPGAVAAAERYQPALLIGPPEGSTSGLYQRWRTPIGSSRVLTVDQPLVAEVEPGVRLELLPMPISSLPTAGGLRSSAVRLVYGRVAILIAPGLTPESARYLALTGSDLQANVLVVPNRGEEGAIDEWMLSAVAPEVTIISVGARNRAGNPSPRTLDLIELLPTFRTDLNGSVEIQSDGSSVWVLPQRSAR